jgi:transposase-like protein
MDRLGRIAGLTRGIGSSRRGFPRQRRRRLAECIARRTAVVFVRWQQGADKTRRDTARQLAMNETTLGRWTRRWRENRLSLAPRGRTVNRTSGDLRRAILTQMTLIGPRAAIRVLRSLYPHVVRAELEDLRRRCWRLGRHKSHRLVYELTWTRPGAVWAMDHAQPRQPVDGAYNRLLLNRDLSSYEQLAALPVVDETAEPVRDSLDGLFGEFGAPLVVKSDNGPPYRSDVVKGLCRANGVAMLFSPPATPSYNGACEAGVGSIKTRTHHEAARHGRARLWTCDDVEAARLEANETARPWGLNGPTPDELWQQRSPITAEERRMFLASCEAYALCERDARGISRGAPLEHYQQAAIDRVAIVRALVEHGYLQFRRRRLHPPVLRTKQCRIS